MQQRNQVRFAGAVDVGTGGDDADYDENEDLYGSGNNNEYQQDPFNEYGEPGNHVLGLINMNMMPQDNRQSDDDSTGAQAGYDNNDQGAYDRIDDDDLYDANTFPTQICNECQQQNDPDALNCQACGVYLGQGPDN